MTLCSVVLSLTYLLIIVRQVIDTTHLSSTVPSEQLIKKLGPTYHSLRNQLKVKAFPSFNAKEQTRQHRKGE
jgi:hypothetical protein